VQDTSAIMADDKETVEDGECDGGHGEEVHGRNRFPVIRKKRTPTFDWLGISWCPLRFIQRETVLSDTSKPNMSSSPWMRGAPQVGFSALRTGQNPLILGHSVASRCIECCQLLFVEP
jgi:hypothetical protein